MIRKQRWIATTALVLSLGLGFGLTGCGGEASPGGAAAPSASASGGDAEPSTQPPVSLDDPDSTGVKALTLSPEAAGRLGIKKVKVQSDPAAMTKSGAQPAQLIMPYAALVYDENGKTWAYVATEDFTYVRKQVVVSRVIGPTAYLAPTSKVGSGTTVVTTGSEELYGAELEISGE